MKLILALVLVLSSPLALALPPADGSLETIANEAGEAMACYVIYDSIARRHDNLTTRMAAKKRAAGLLAAHKTALASVGRHYSMAEMEIIRQMLQKEIAQLKAQIAAASIEDTEEKFLHILPCEALSQQYLNSLELFAEEAF